MHRFKGGRSRKKPEPMTDAEQVAKIRQQWRRARRWYSEESIDRLIGYTEGRPMPWGRFRFNLTDRRSD